MRLSTSLIISRTHLDYARRNRLRVGYWTEEIWDSYYDQPAEGANTQLIGIKINSIFIGIQWTHIWSDV